MSKKSLSLEGAPTGTKVICYIHGNGPMFAMVSNEDDEIYLCQNRHDGSRADDTLGFRYSWSVSRGTIERIFSNEAIVLQKWEPGDDGYETAEFTWQADSIKKYISELNKSPVYLVSEAVEPLLINASDEQELLEQIIYLSSSYTSIRENKTIVRPSGVYVTADILWRHILFYKDVSIYWVLESLYEMVMDERISQFILEGKRRFVPYAERYEGDLYSTDEFGISFDSWKYIDDLLEVKHER